MGAKTPPHLIPKVKIMKTPNLACGLALTKIVYHYFVLGGIHTLFKISNEQMFLRVSLNSCLLNLLLGQNHLAKIIFFFKHFIQGRKIETMSKLNKVQSISIVVKTMYFPLDNAFHILKSQTEEPSNAYAV